jgi:c-di-GMP-binding flagellar brake protein YcgR
MDTVQKERRRHIRYRMDKNVLSISDDILAEVLDISTCGMGCQGLTSCEKPLTEINEIEILNCELGTSVEGLHCRLVRTRERAISDALTSTMIVNFGLEFQGLSETQRKKLHLFIKDNSLHEAVAFL